MTVTVYDNFRTVPLDELLVDFSYEFPDIPDDAAMHYARRAAITMAREGNLITRTVTVCTQAGVHNYRLDVPDCLQIVAIMAIRNICGNCPREVARLPMAPTHPWCGRVSAWLEPPRVLCLTEIGDNWFFEVDVSVAPTLDACELDANYRDLYYETLLLGMRSIALGLHGKAWANQTLSSTLADEFLQSIRNNAVDKLTGGQRGAFRTNKPRVL